MDHRLEPFLELTAELCPRHQRPKIKGKKFLALEPLRHVPGNNTPGQPFGNGRFTHSRFPNKNGIVLCPPGQYLHHPAYFLVPAYHRVKLFLTGQGCQVPAVLFQRLVLFLGILVRHPLAAPDRFKRAKDRLLVDPGACQNTGGLSVRSGNGNKNMLRRNKFVF